MCVVVHRYSPTGCDREVGGGCICSSGLMIPAAASGGWTVFVKTGAGPPVLSKTGCIICLPGWKMYGCMSLLGPLILISNMFPG